MRVNEKLVFHGLKPGDYIHPKDIAFRNSNGKDAGLAARGLSTLSNASLAVSRRITEGRYVEVSEETAPYLVGILRDVCKILDVPYVPRLFIGHERSTNTTVGGAGDECSQILLPDYIAQEYDEDMLYYILGNAVAMLKAGHVKLATVCSVMVDSPVTQLFEMVIEAWMRAADLSSDRGGLLACQSYAAAARCIMAEAGLPPREMRGMTDPEVVELADAFMIGADEVCPNWMANLSKIWKKMNWSASPPVERLRELTAWYNNEYPALIEKWKGGELY